MSAGTEGARWRLFVAALLSDANREALNAPIVDLAALMPLVSPSRVEAIHLTLHFLGLVEIERVERLRMGLASAVAPFQHIEVAVAGVGAFPTLARARVLWAGISGPQLARLRELQAASGVVLRAAGIVTESRGYAPHLTLGRLRGKPGPEDRAALVRWADRWAAASFGSLRVDAIQLMRSDLSQRPPKYTRIESFPLQ